MLEPAPVWEGGWAASLRCDSAHYVKALELIVGALATMHLGRVAQRRPKALLLNTGFITPDSHLVFKPTPLCTTYHLLCRCLCTSQCSHDRGSLRFQFPSSDQLCGYLHSQASEIWQLPAPLYCPLQGHICRAQLSQSGPRGKDSYAWLEKLQTGPAGTHLEDKARWRQEHPMGEGQSLQQTALRQVEKHAKQWN